MSKLWQLFCLFGFCFIVLGIWRYSTGAPSQPVQVSPAVFRLDDVAAGLHPFQFEIRNNTNSQIVLVGCNARCSPHGCADLSGFPQTIGPGDSAELNGQFSVGNPGKIDYQVTLWTDSPVIGILTLNIQGSCKGKVVSQVR
jgi:hypothetical protein